MPTLFRAAAVTIIKNEAPYIAEWIEYHALLGIEHVFIFDNDSEDALDDALRPYLAGGRATLLRWPYYPGQMAAYNYAIRMFGHACDWMTLLDMDEFIHLARPGTLPDYWDSLGDVDQVLMPWMIFGAGGHADKPAGLVTESYRHRLAEPAGPVKCAVRPAAVLSAEVHHCVTRSGRTVNGDGMPVPEGWRLNRPAPNIARVHHYITKSRAEWAAKVARGQADGTIWRREEEFLSYQGDVFDDAVARRAPEVRAMLARTATEPAARHVALAHSVLSELTPSRRWMLQAMRRLQAAGAAPGEAEAWRLLLRVDEALLHRPGRHLGTSERAATDAFAGLVADVKAEPASADRLGRLFLCLRVEADAATTLHTSVRGRDAAGHAHEHRREVAIEAGTTLGLIVLSARTITVESLDLDWPDGPPPDALAWETYSFI